MEYTWQFIYVAPAFMWQPAGALSVAVKGPALPGHLL